MSLFKRLFPLIQTPQTNIDWYDESRLVPFSFHQIFYCGEAEWISVAALQHRSLTGVSSKGQPETARCRKKLMTFISAVSGISITTWVHVPELQKTVLIKKAMLGIEGAAKILIQNGAFCSGQF